MASFVVTAVESTPNPNAVKLLLDRPVAAEPISLRTCDDLDRKETNSGDATVVGEVTPVERGVGNGLARELMSIPGVRSVLLLNDFVTINKSPEARWADITRKAKQVLAGPKKKTPAPRKKGD